ncbi:tight adherence protein B [Peptoclostridium litorale DSM 5388]|uniref:Type II secretion system F protein n=1 Tax=Peptoclostridium litorale DSM 5388 TaxID=1121324 RepID=A0A069R9N6_PEPLI|nr:type II secretion system F family protein [Peptoclostridium litorale]KDR93779.1 type II secretion system F protein [Peptoclostridium litorale DSM 5388]SIN85699.1 tight adherence protein B [Peptoclostridium litorale DSM 5388]
MIYAVTAVIFIEILILSSVVLGHIMYKKPIIRLNRYLEKSHYIELDENKNSDKHWNLKEFKNYRQRLEGSAENIGFLRQKREKLDNKLAMAGILFTVEEFLLASFGAVLLSLYLGYKMSSSIIGGIVLSLVVVISIVMIVKLKEKKRIEEFNRQLGDAMDMMSGTLRAGYSFMQAMDTVAREMPKPISREFSKVIREMQMGMPLEKAFEDLLGRVRTDDLELLVTSVLIHRQIGGNLAEILENISSTIRERIKLKGEIKVMTAQARASGIVVSLLPFGFAVIITMINPNHMATLFSDRLGIIMVMMAILGQFVGFLIVRKIMDIKY